MRDAVRVRCRLTRAALRRSSAQAPDFPPLIGESDSVRTVAIHPIQSGESFAEFPADANLAGFDRADRKFVAVALASGDSPPIVNATDSDWWLFREALQRHGVQVEFLCPELMQAR